MRRKTFSYMNCSIARSRERGRSATEFSVFEVSL